jgi:hypothetical protein
MSDDEYPTPEESEANRNKVEESLKGPKLVFERKVEPQQEKEEIGSINYHRRIMDKYYCRGTINGQFYVINERLSNKISFMKRSDFIHSLESEKALIQTLGPKGESGSKFEPISKIWLEGKSNREFDDMVFDCQLPYGLHNRIYNLWRGFVTEAQPGNCSLTLTYIKEIICYNNNDAYNWVMSFLAHMVQKPWEKPEVALILVGDKGIGKTFFMDIVKMLIDGKNRHLHCFKTSNSEDIYGSHREALRNLIALLLEEVTWGGDKPHVGTLNDLTSGRTLTINIKNGPIITVNNIMRIIMAGNPGWIIPASPDERRYTMLRVSSERQQQHSYFSAIQNELNNGGYEALMYELIHRDISKFNCREAYITDELIKQKRLGETDFESWWIDKIISARIDMHKDHLDEVTNDNDKEYNNNGFYNYVTVSNDILWKDYCNSMRRINSKQKLMRKDEFWIKMNDIIPKLDSDGNKIMNKDGRRTESLITGWRGPKPERTYCSVIPPLMIVRELIDIRLKRKLQWNDSKYWEKPESEPF